MIGHYLLNAMRQFRRDLLATGIKILALALGLVCLLTAHMIGDYFREADAQWMRANQTLVIVQEAAALADDWMSVGLVGSGPALAEFLQEDFPELESIARLNTLAFEAKVEGRDAAWQAFGADPAFVEIFDLDMVRGAASLARPRSALISERVAEAAFGIGDPVGQALILRNGVEVTVAGVFRNVLPPSHLSTLGDSGLEILVDLDSISNNGAAQGIFVGGPGGRVQFGFTTYVVLPRSGSISIDTLNDRLSAFSERHYAQGAMELRFRAVPVGSVTETQFNSETGYLFGISIVTALYLLGSIALVIGCINFANLGVAQAGSRAREIGMRRVAGASKLSIAAQMLVESGLIVFGALVLVLPILGMIAQVVARQFGLELSPPGLSRIDFWASVLGIVIAVAVVSSVYPALVLARLNPAVAIRINGFRGSASFVRRFLIGSQFAAAAFLLVLVAVMVEQRTNLRHEVANPDQDPIISIRLPRNSSDPGYLSSPNETLRERLLANRAITGVTFGDAPFGVVQGPFDEGEGLTMDLSLSPDTTARSIQSQWGQVYYDYFETNGAELLAGRTFSRERNDQLVAVIDRATAEKLGYTPEEAIGASLYQHSPLFAQPRELTIAGVVDRDRWHLRTDGPTNFFYTFEPATPVMVVRLSREDVEEALSHVRRVWEGIAPDTQFNPTFLDEAFEQRYQSFAMINFIFIALSGVAVAIAAMGLFGMATFVVQRRLREVGIRKTIGASMAQMLNLLLWEFSKPIVVANLIAWPLAYIAAQAYLAMFVNRIELTATPFLVALAVTVLIASVAVVSQVWRTAGVRPAQVLHYE